MCNICRSHLRSSEALLRQVLPLLSPDDYLGHELLQIECGEALKLLEALHGPLGSPNVGAPKKGSMIDKQDADHRKSSCPAAQEYLWQGMRLLRNCPRRKETPEKPCRFWSKGFRVTVKFLDLLLRTLQHAETSCFHPTRILQPGLQEFYGTRF